MKPEAVAFGAAVGLVMAYIIWRAHIGQTLVDTVTKKKAKH